jgi:hypothetical protein
MLRLRYDKEIFQRMTLCCGPSFRHRKTGQHSQVASSVGNVTLCQVRLRRTIPAIIPAHKTRSVWTGSTGLLCLSMSSSSSFIFRWLSGVVLRSLGKLVFQIFDISDVWRLSNPAFRFNETYCFSNRKSDTVSVSLKLFL